MRHLRPALRLLFSLISIVRIGDSKKQGKRTKVGRFGVGFNSVYHTTDVPRYGHSCENCDARLEHA